MEKRLVLFLILTFGIVILWLQIVPQPKKKPPKKQPPVATGESDEQPGPGTVEEPGTIPEPGPGTAPPVPATDRPTPIPPPSDSDVVIDSDNLRIRWTLDRWGGSLKQVAFKEYSERPDQDPSADPASRYHLVSKNLLAKKSTRSPRMLAVDVIDEDGRVVLRTSKVLWDLAERSEERVVFRLDIPAAGATLVKEFTFPREVEGVSGGAWHLDLTFRLEVEDAKKAAQFGADAWRIRMTGPSGLAAEPTTSLGVMLQVEVLTLDRVKGEYFRPPSRPGGEPRVYPDAKDQAAGRRIDWLAYHSRFFTGALRPYDGVRTDAYRTLTYAIEDLNYEGKKPIVNAITAIEFPMPLDEDGGRPERRFMFFAGPMDPKILKSPPYETFEYLVDYGMFGIPKLLLGLLGIIQSVVGSWGIAIIVLTIIVRLSMFPISRKSQLATQRYSKKMGRLKPKMDVIKEKHENNKKKQQEEMMKLYKEEGVRPPLGCLLMFLQLPVFIGLFVALRKSIDLRHAEFLWAKDLAGPDKLIPDLLTGHSLPLLADPLHLNLFPILMGVFWFLSAAQAPKSADPQQQSMMKMMKWMPIIFTLMLYNYAAGLALYMIISSLWSIFETKVVKKILFKEENLGDVGVPSATFRKGR